MTATDVLFRPFRIRAMELANRIVMAPMTRSFAVNGVPGVAVERTAGWALSSPKAR
jgi:2,4-dienoyl-CoA reductase-like NADH-dependent reductase (Old Yellow Enzyme family)